MTHKDRLVLEKYTSLDLSEVSNYVDALLAISTFSTDHGMSVEFERTLENELQRLLSHYRANCKIITKTVPRLPAVYNELEWLDDV